MEKPIRPFMKQFYRGNDWYLVLSLIQTMFMTASGLMISWLIQQIIDLITGADTGFTLFELFLLGIVNLLLLLGAYAFAYISKPRFIARAISQYKEYVFERLCQKGIAAFSGENSALYISALSNDTASIENNYLNNLFLILDNTLLFVGALGLMFYYSPLLAIISIGLSLLPLIASICTGNLVAKAEKQVSDKNASYMDTLKDSLTGFSVIKTFRAELRMCRIFGEKAREVAQAQCWRKKMDILVEMLGSASGSIVQMGVFLIGAYLALSGKGLSAGSVLVFVQLLNYVITPIAVIPKALAERKAARALVGKIAKALSENVRDNGTEKKLVLANGIRLKDLSFCYEADKPVLKAVDFTFESGKRYAVVGNSGSGKSTLLNLLLASHDTYTGTIFYDETELRDIRADSLYEMVSQVQQNVFIFNASIRDNITMFAEFPPEKVERAIDLAGLARLIRERGEDYLCGENGCGLSGGEKQRVSIARSLLRGTQVLLMDEATAALDPQTASQVAGAILDLDGITRIVVTHALEEQMLKRYDCILAMKNGTIAEWGTFDALMDQKGFFYSLYTVSQ